MASKEDVRKWAKASALGAKLEDDQKAAITRTIGQAGLEGKKVERLLKGEEE